MKILHVITSLRTGGAEKLLVDLLPAFKSMGHTVELLLFDGTVTPFYTQLRKDGINIHNLSIGGNVYNPINIFKLKRYLNEFDIVHTHNTACQYYVALAKAMFNSTCKLFTTEHSTNNRRRYFKLFKYTDKFIYKQYQSIISVSNKTTLNLRKHIELSLPIKTIYNGIDTTKYYNIPREFKKGDKIIVTMIAAFRHEKDHDTLVRAFSTLPQNYNLWLIGQGPRQQEIKAMVYNLGISNRVIFTDFVENIPKALHMSHIVVLSSHWEGFGLAALEGMASNLPVIVSDIDGIREVVGSSAVLFKPHDHIDLANKIIELCVNPKMYHVYSEAGLNRSYEFDIKITAQKYANLYTTNA